MGSSVMAGGRGGIGPADSGEIARRQRGGSGQGGRVDRGEPNGILGLEESWLGMGAQRRTVDGGGSGRRRWGSDRNPAVLSGVVASR